jgi:hypothetical protein
VLLEVHPASRRTAITFGSLMAHIDIGDIRLTEYASSGASPWPNCPMCC